MLRERGRLLGSAMAGLAVLVVVGLVLTPAQGRVAARTTNASQQPKTAVICLDVTLSVSHKIIPQSLKLIAREVMAQPYPGSSEFIAYVRTIRDNSVNPTNNLLLVDIPRVRKARHESSSNLDPSTIQTQTALYNQQERARQNRDLAVARTVAREDATKTIHLTVSPDTKVGTDLYSCPEVSTRLMNPYGQNYLLVISDLLPYGHQGADPGNFHLPQATVIDIDYCEKDFRICDRAESTFEKILKRHGAKRIVSFDSSQLPILHGIFNP
jgi:hypothetical protein